MAALLCLCSIYPMRETGVWAGLIWVAWLLFFAPRKGWGGIAHILYEMGEGIR